MFVGEASGELLRRVQRPLRELWNRTWREDPGRQVLRV